MTTQQIEKLGFPFIGTKLKNRLFWCDSIGEFNIPDYWQISDIHKHIFEKGIEKGEKIGKLKRTNEFREILGLDNCSEYDLY
jgi:hypothetical protein